MTKSHLPTPLRGIVPPMVTPLKDRETLDLEAIDRLIEHLVRGGVAGLFILGTSGEGPGLSYRLRYELVEHVCEVVADRVPVLVGVTDPSLEEALEMAGWAEDCGAAAIVAAPPYYFPMAQAELLRYFTVLAEESPLPLMLYNIPPCTHLDISLDTLRRCCEVERIVGIKDSSGDLEYFRAALALRAQRPDWTFLIGPEHMLAETALLGGDGGVNGGANITPTLFVELFEAARSGDRPTVERLQQRVLTLGRLYQGEPVVPSVIQGLKGALAVLGLCDDLLVEPFARPSAAKRQEIERVLTELGLLTREVHPQTT